jgi:hypothetical protein
MAQTSDKISSIAARYVNLTSRRLIVLTKDDASTAQTSEDIRSMAASLLRQDEERGLRKLWRKVTGG